MVNHSQRKKSIRGFYSDKFTRYFRGFFLPLSRALMKAGVTPNTVTFISLILGAFTGFLFAMDYLWTGLAFGLAMGFSDIVDGQLAKEFGGATKFGGILDSTIDRYNEFFIYTGFAFRYYFQGRHLWIALCAFAFLGSVMISYIRARAESDGFECKVGKLQRPERLSLIGIGVLFRGTGIDCVVAFLAIFTQATSLYRLVHVYNQSKKIDSENL